MSMLQSPTKQPNPNPTTPAFTDDVEWFTAYLQIHALNQTSWRYAYIFWLAIGLVTLTFTVFHSLGLRSGTFGAYWSKWSLRRRTWRKKHSLAQAKKSGQPHKQPFVLPSNAQLLCLSSLIAACLVATFVGPDYIAPTKRLWEFRRAVIPDVAAYTPQYTIQKAWWTSGDRAGLITFALFPLCVLFVLKRPPFAIFAISFLTNIHFDKLTWLHRWTGRLIWAMAALHATLWSVQLVKDTRSNTGKIAYVYAWQYPRFIYAWTAFGLFTLLILLSLGPIREKHYEIFYAFHVILVPATIVMSALHHPPLWWWCWITLLLWVGERIWRALSWVYVNGFLGSRVSVSPISSRSQTLSTHGQSKEMHSFFPDVEPTSFAADQESYTRELSRHPRPISYSASESPLYHTHHLSSPSHSLLPSVPPTFSIPVGYAHAEVLAGRTIRLHLIPPGRLTWAPGQHFLLCIPSISKFGSHPFTCASVCDKQKPGVDGRMIMFLIRAKNGWTEDLWSTVVGLLIGGHRHPAREAPVGITLPTTGVLLKAWVDGPFGSPARTNWNLYSTAMIVCGGSGVSFGISVLEYLCLCMTGKNGRYLGGNVGRSKVFPMRRIRFIWILRDFAHMQWCASVLHRCKLLVPPESLQFDLFVTNFNPPVPHPQALSGAGGVTTSDIPDASFSAAPSPVVEVEGISLNQEDLIDAQSADDGYVDLSYYRGDYKESGELGHEEHWLDLTNFDGDNDDRMPGENFLNRLLKREGTIRRALKKVSRRSRPPPERVDSGSRGLSGSPAFPGETGEPPSSSFCPPGDPASLKPDSLGRCRTSSRFSNEGDGDHPVEGSKDWKRRSSTLVDEAPEGLKLELGDKEMQDIRIVAEFARPGRPKLDLILRDEVEAATGRIVVASCGPTTLNTVIRKAVAAQIEPLRIRRGDNSGSIDLVAEEFGH